MYRTVSFIDKMRSVNVFVLFAKDSERQKHSQIACCLGDCSCRDNYISEIMRNVEVEIVQHSNPCSDSEPVPHLHENLSHSFSWRILCNSKAQYFHKCRIIEGLMIQQWNPSLNKQVHSHIVENARFFLLTFYGPVKVFLLTYVLL